MPASNLASQTTGICSVLQRHRYILNPCWRGESAHSSWLSDVFGASRPPTCTNYSVLFDGWCRGCCSTHRNEIPQA